MSKNIVKAIREISKLYHGEGCSMSQILEAQEKLGIQFPPEYVAYVKEFGAISFFGTEWTGLNVDGYLNTVNATNDEKSVNGTFPEGFFVIEDLSVDARKAVVNELGQVYLLRYDKLEYLCDSLSDYLKQCVARNTYVE